MTIYDYDLEFLEDGRHNVVKRQYLADLDELRGDRKAVQQ